MSGASSAGTSTSGPARGVSSPATGSFLNGATSGARMLGIPPPLSFLGASGPSSLCEPRGVRFLKKSPTAPVVADQFSLVFLRKVDKGLSDARHAPSTSSTRACAAASASDSITAVIASSTSVSTIELAVASAAASLESDFAGAADAGFAPGSCFEAGFADGAVVSAAGGVGADSGGTSAFGSPLGSSLAGLVSTGSSTVRVGACVLEQHPMLIADPFDRRHLPCQATCSPAPLQ